MSQSDGKFRHDSLQSRKTIKQLLDALTKGMGKGELTLSDGDDTLTLPVEDLLTVRLRADRSDGACRVDLRLTWNTDEPMPKGKSPLDIS